MSEKEPIIIPLEKSTNATSSFDTNNLFQREALNKIKYLIEKNFEEMKGYTFPKDETSFDRFHNAITILGERGTGKTSFLINLEKSFPDEKYIFLDPLDPTLFEDKQNILVSIISLIADEINAKDEIKDKDNWIDYLTKLSDGLNLLDGIGSNPMQKDIWDDSRIILDKGLTSAHSGINFEKNFHKFIDESLNILKSDLFILRFDDIDTSVLKGWPVLEVIRKYLTTPKIQIIISGDINLFSKLVRLKQWENLEKLTEFEKNTNLNETIDQLEEQYLTKILKPENRIYLQSLESILKKTPNLIEIEFKKEKNLTIEIIYEDIANKIFILERKRDKETFQKILLKLPIRTNIQILTAYYNNLYNNKNYEGFLHDFALIFMTNFSKFNFKFEDTFTLTSYKENIISYLIDKLVFIKNYMNLSSIKDLKSLQPKYDDKDLNLFLIYLNASVVNSISKSVSIIFDWYLKKFYFFKILENYSNEKKYDENTLINYLNISSPLIETSTRINGILFTEDKNGYENYAKVYMQKRQVKDNGEGYDTYISLLNQKFQKISPNTLTTFSILHNIIFNKVRAKNESVTYLNTSILNIFSFIGSILNFKKEEEESFDNYVKPLITDKVINAFVEDIYSDIIVNEIEENFENIGLLKELEKWIESKNKVIPFSIQLIEDIWNEFYDREKSIKNTNKVGEFLELQIFVFLNAIFKTINIHKNNRTTRFITDAASAKKRFFEHIKGTKYENVSNLDLSNKELEIDFLEFILICPIWRYLVNLNDSPQFNFELALETNETSPNSYSDYLKLLSLHQGTNDIKELTNNEESKNDTEIIENKEKTKYSRYSLGKIKNIIQNLDKEKLSMPNVINIIWEEAKNKYHLNSTLDDSKKQDIENELTNYLKKDNE